MSEGALCQTVFFWLRSGSKICYPGLSQGGNSHCVYASVAGAINYIVGRPCWTVATLVAECDLRGETNPTFDAVVPIATEPYTDVVIYDIARERFKSLSPEGFVTQLAAWISTGGIAIISLEVADGPLSSSRRLQNYHMLTLVAKVGDNFQVWDSNDFEGLLTPEEIKLGFRYPPIEAHPEPWMISHPEHDCVLFAAKRSNNTDG